MFKPIATFSGFSVDDLAKAKEFYETKLGLKTEDAVGGAHIILPGGAKAWMYPKKDHVPASYTMLDFIVDNIDTAVDKLTKQGVIFEHYDQAPQDAKGVLRGKEHNMGPNIAWFKDPAGNILAILEQ
jgi:catechol 2,3-dioxygenase-like lactoylglutathione lyase family enzyme